MGMIYFFVTSNHNKCQFLDYLVQTKIVDAEYVDQLFGSKRSLLTGLSSLDNSELPVQMTKHGEILGSVTFLKLALKKHYRRQTLQDQSMGVKRKDERYFDPVDKVLQEFKNIHGVSFSSLRELYRRTRRK